MSVQLAEQALERVSRTPLPSSAAKLGQKTCRKTDCPFHPRGSSLTRVRAYTFVFCGSPPSPYRTMQASWGAENSAPGPARGGQLFGEAGTWKVSMECSVPDVFTYADKEVSRGREGGLGRAGAVVYCQLGGGCVVPTPRGLMV